jgi:hypothetical protein
MKLFKNLLDIIKRRVTGKPSFTDKVLRPDGGKTDIIVLDEASMISEELFDRNTEPVENSCDGPSTVIDKTWVSKNEDIKDYYFDSDNSSLFTIEFIKLLY